MIGYILQGMGCKRGVCLACLQDLGNRAAEGQQGAVPELVEG